MADYYERSVEPLLQELLEGMPAVLVTGPRATGKTTTASRFAQTVIRLDQENEAAAFHADPDAALRGLPEPVLLDEWQAVPSVLGAVKRTVDTDDVGSFTAILRGGAIADLRFSRIATGYRNSASFEIVGERAEDPDVVAIAVGKGGGVLHQHAHCSRW